MAYKIRIILNSDEDVIRDIAIRKSVTLEELHLSIKNAFDFTTNEMASFYRTDEDWVQGEEFPLFDMSEGMDAKMAMRDIVLEKVLNSKDDKLIYIYDFFNMWSFSVELIDDYLQQDKKQLPDLLFSLGNVPKAAPDIQFESDDLSIDAFEKEEDNEFDEMDFDAYME